MSGVSTICFAASYAIALAVEVSRLWFRSGVRGVFLFGFAGAGLVAHTAFLYHRAVEAVGAPLSSEMDWYLVAAWALVAVYLCLAAFSPKAPFGLFLLPLSLVLIGIATFWANRTAVADAPALKVWGAIHGLSIMLAAVSVLIGFTAGIMYFVQTRQLKNKRLPGRGLRLPSLEWLQRVNSRAIVLAVMLLTAGVASGAILNRIDAANDMTSLPWYDPVVLSTLLLLVWLFAAVLIGAVYRPARQGRKVAFFTLVSFLILAIVLAAGLLLNSRHWDRDARRHREETHASHVTPLGKGGLQLAADRDASSEMQLARFLIGGRPC